MNRGTNFWIILDVFDEIFDVCKFFKNIRAGFVFVDLRNVKKHKLSFLILVFSIGRGL